MQYKVYFAIQSLLCMQICIGKLSQKIQSLLEKSGDFIKKESESLIFTGLEIPREGGTMYYSICYIEEGKRYDRSYCEVLFEGREQGVFLAFWNPRKRIVGDLRTEKKKLEKLVESYLLPSIYAREEELAVAIEHILFHVKTHPKEEIGVLCVLDSKLYYIFSEMGEVGVIEEGRRKFVSTHPCLSLIEKRGWKKHSIEQIGNDWERACSEVFDSFFLILLE